MESDDDSEIDEVPSNSVPGPSTLPSQSHAPLEGLDEEDEAMEEDGDMQMTLHGVDG